METDPLDARSSLDAVAAAERRSAEIATSTPWYAPWYGVTCSLFPIAFALLGSHLAGVGVAVLAVVLASLTALVSTYQRVTGVWPMGRGVLGPQILAFIVLGASVAIGYFVAGVYGPGWWLLPLAVVTGVLMMLTSIYYDRAYARKHGVR